jgi:23S rRNA pseudouridine1911/1915/1917 synthase
VTDPTRTVEAAAGARLDTFVHQLLPGWSRRLVHRLIRKGDVRVNARRVAKGTRLRQGDRVTLPDLPSRLRPEPAPGLPVVYEDAHLVVVDKPGGMPGHALDPRQRGTAAAVLLARYPELARVGDPLAPGLAHRLDTGTSGLLLAARTPAAYATLRATFRAHAVEKRYLAVVAATVPVRNRRISLPLAHDPQDRRRMTAARPGERAWPAETDVAVLAARADRALVAATIRTGVTHQVRVHLAHAGYPVLGDAVYGGPAVDLPPGRHALHAARLRLCHPVSGQPLAFESALPEDLAALLA